MATTTLAPPPPFVRDRLTWLHYLMMGYFAYFVISLSPILPFLRAEFQLTYALGGLHLSMLALGNVAVGFYGAYCIRRWGRRRILWVGSAGIAVGALLLSMAGHVALTLASAFLMGAVGTFVPVVVQASLSDHHGEHRAIALTESNVSVMVFAVVIPLIIGIGESTGIGWRGGLYLGALLWLILSVTFRNQPVPDAPPPDNPATDTRPRLPLLFWAYWLVLYLSVAIEWCISLWGATFFIDYVGLEPALASSLMSLFFIGMVVGRTASSYAVRVYPITTLLLYAEGTALAGFLLLWLAPYAPLKMVGLFVAGLGVAGLFPLAVSAGIGVAPEQANTASARISMGAGVAMLSAPFFLGWLADQVQLFYAFGVVIVLVVVIVALTLVLRGRP